MSTHQHNHAEHTHTHAPVQFGKAFAIATLLNALFVVLQVLYAYLANSTSLLADAIHNLGDVLGLAMAWGANILLSKHPTIRQSYGMKKTSILASLANGILLVFSCGIIATEAIYKLFAPEIVNAIPVMIVCAIGIVINGGTAMLFMRGQKDLNIRLAYLHLVYDAVISVSVLLSAGLLYFTHWTWLDPLMGLIIACVIIKGTWFLFMDSLHLLIDAVPKHISLTAVHTFLTEQSGVKQVHDLHIWALSTRENALSVHVWMPDLIWTDAQRQQIVHHLKEKFDIHHSTIQIERSLEYCEDKCLIS